VTNMAATESRTWQVTANTYDLTISSDAAAGRDVSVPAGV